MTIIPDYLAATDPETVIVYGHSSNPAAVLRQAADGAGGPVLTPLYARLPAGSPSLRVNSPGWLSIPISLLPELNTPETMRAHCRQKIIINAAQFAKLPRQFINAYLDYALKVALAGAPEGVPDLFEPDDWFYSAWLPLASSENSATGGGDQIDFAEVDIAYWINGRLLLVTIEGSSARRKSDQEKLDRLIDTHPALDHIPVPRDSFAEDHFPADLFPTYFSDF